MSLLVPADVAHSGLRGDNDNDHWGIIVIGLMTRQVSDIQTRHLMPDTLASYLWLVIRLLRQSLVIGDARSGHGASGHQRCER